MPKKFSETKKFFWGDASGLNADIERHRKQEKELEQKIAELEAMPEEKRLKTYESVLRTYRQFLYQLQVSKAEVVSKIGKAK